MSLADAGAHRLLFRQLDKEGGGPMKGLLTWPVGDDGSGSIPVSAPGGWGRGWVLPAQTSSPGEARALVATALAAAGFEYEVVYSFALYTSELVTNSVTWARRCRSRGSILVVLAYEPAARQVVLTCLDSNGKFGRQVPPLERIRGPVFDLRDWDGSSLHVGLGLVRELSREMGGDLLTRRWGSCNIARVWAPVAVI